MHFDEALLHCVHEGLGLGVVAGGGGADGHGDVAVPVVVADAVAVGHQGTVQHHGWEIATYLQRSGEVPASTYGGGKVLGT